MRRSSALWAAKYPEWGKDKDMRRLSPS